MDVGAVASKFSQLRLAEKSAVSLEKTEAEYVLHMDSQSCEQCGNQARLAATSSNNSVRIYTRENMGHIASIKGHDKVITGVRFGRTSEDLLYTSSLDGTIKCWDMRSSYEEPAMTYEGYEQTNNIFTSFDVSCDDRLVCAGTEAKKEDTHLIFWDRRKSDLLGVYEDSHQDDITQVCFHPTSADRLASGSTDGLVCTFDVSQPTEDDALLNTFNSESSVNRVGWCGPSLDQVYCLTHIETFHIWDSQEADCLTEITNTRDRFEGRQSIDYLVDCFQATESPWPVLVAGTHRGQLQLLSVDGHQLHHLLTLGPGHTDDVRCLNWQSETETLVTGGDDSMLCLWKPGSTQVESSSRKQKASSKTKAKIKKSIKKSSLPY